MGSSLGDYNPAGRLPISFPINAGYLPCYYSQLPGGSSAYLEGERKALFAFGHGLSYTDFAYSNIWAKKTGVCDFTVGVTIENTGNQTGDEVVQLYVNDVCSSIAIPQKLLSGFQRITLNPHEKKELTFTLGFENLRLFDRNKEWVVEAGDFKIMIGASSDDIRLETSINVDQNCRQAGAVIEP